MPHHKQKKQEHNFMMNASKIVLVVMLFCTLEAKVHKRGVTSPLRNLRERRIELQITKEALNTFNQGWMSSAINSQSAKFKTEVSSKGRPLVAPAQEFVIGGMSVPKGTAPWQALLQLDGTYYCGASIISPTCILTAAHCAVGISKFIITVGSVDLNEPKKVTFISTNSVIHNKYDPTTMNNDIAVVILKETILFGPNITAVRLPRYRDSNNTFLGVQATGCGFGLTENAGTTVSSLLNCIFLKVTDNKSCSTVFGLSYVVNSTLCTQADKSKALCSGDSGGPLVYREVDGQFTQIGIVSFGSSTSCTQYPNGFARITSYLDWIVKVCGVSLRA